MSTRSSTGLSEQAPVRQRATRLSELIAAGTPGTRLAFGAAGPLLRSEDLMDAGRSLYSSQAEADRVGLLMTNDRPTVEVVLGALASGCTVVSLPPPSRGADLGAYATFLKEACTTQDITEVVVADENASLVASTGVSVRPHSERTARPLAAPSHTGFGLVQFTSGSTGSPQPILLDDIRLGANVGAILAAVQPQPGDRVVSWLPLGHDMGLVGMLLAGISGAGPLWGGHVDIVLLDPVTFLRRPASWAEALDRWRGTVTAAPDFGYRMAAQRAPASSLDLSQVRCAIVGGEIVRGETLGDFATAYRAHGFDERALCPAYGLAEVGLAVAMTRPEQLWRSMTLSVADLADGRIREPRTGEVALTLVSSGELLPGYDVSCRPDVGIGQVVVHGPSIGRDGVTRKDLATEDGYFTGDTGFLDDGWLHVCGRMDDYVIARGRKVYAPAVEAAAGALAGLRPGRVTAVGLPTGHWTIVAEMNERALSNRAHCDSLEQAIRRTAVHVASARPDSILLVSPGSLPLTSSGKLQRNRVRAQVVNNQLPDVRE